MQKVFIFKKKKKKKRSSAGFEPTTSSMQVSCCYGFRWNFSPLFRLRPAAEITASTRNKKLEGGGG